MTLSFLRSGDAKTFLFESPKLHLILIEGVGSIRGDSYVSEGTHQLTVSTDCVPPLGQRPRPGDSGMLFGDSGEILMAGDRLFVGTTIAREGLLRYTFRGTLLSRLPASQVKRWLSL